MRLDRYLANNSSFSRKKVKAALKNGNVLVDGEVATDPSRHISTSNHIEFFGQPLTERGPGYFMLFKPDGVVCANRDKNFDTMFDLIDEEHPGLHVAGRLDIDTTGLVLITGDGNWSHRITSPKYQCVKIYRVSTAELVTEKMIQKLETGVYIGQEKKRTAPAQVEQITEDEILLSITEGRYHQVKQMLAAVGNAVESLHRERIGAIKLDENLHPGDYRPLTEAEIRSV